MSYVQIFHSIPIPTSLYIFRIKGCYNNIQILKNENKMKMSVIPSELEEASDLDHDIIKKKKAWNNAFTHTANMKYRYWAILR